MEHNERGPVFGDPYKSSASARTAVGTRARNSSRTDPVSRTADPAWRCRTCGTRNAVGWQVCRACGGARPRTRAWMAWRGNRPLLIGGGAAAAMTLGIWVLNAWTAIIGTGAWLVAGTLLWTLLIVIAAGVAWQRTR